MNSEYEYIRLQLRSGNFPNANLIVVSLNFIIKQHWKFSGCATEMIMTH
jgi:hypothetical protein